MNILSLMPARQVSAIKQALRGEESPWFQEKLSQLNKTLAEVPGIAVTEETPCDEKTVYLKFFIGGFTYYVAEIDKNGEDVFGVSIDMMLEWGYMTIGELKRAGAEIDLHFKPCKFSEIDS